VTSFARKLQLCVPRGFLSFIAFTGLLTFVPSVAFAQGCEENCDTEPPTVTPSFDQALLPVDTVRITWCDNVSLVSGSKYVTLNSVNITSAFSYTTPAGSCTAFAISVGAATLSPGTTYSLFATIEDNDGNIGTGTAQYTAPNGWVAVNPKGLTLSKPQQSSGFSQPFTVHNLGSTAAYFKLVRTCVSPVTSCGTVPDSIQINGTDSSVVSVTYSTSSPDAATGTIKLRARLRTDTTVADSTTVSVTLLKSIIVDGSPNNNDAQNMRLCAYSCFANIYSHATVPYFSLDRPRAVTIVWNSMRNYTHPFLHFDISFVSGAPAVDTLELTVKDSATGTAIKVQGDDNGHRGIVYFKRGSGSVVRIGTVITDDAWILPKATGIIPVEVTVKAIRATYTETVTLVVPLLIVREPAGAVTRGWYVDGIQRIHPQSGGRILVVESDGSAFVFSPIDTLGHYSSPESEFSVLSRAGSGGNTVYTRAYLDSTKLRFDSQGLMLDATDSWGNKIRYTYNGNGQPTRIYDPYRTRPDSTAAPSAYTEIAYSGSNVYIRPPQRDGASYDAARVTTLRINTDSTLRAIIDPDGDSTRFTYKGYGAFPSPYTNRKVFLENVYGRNDSLTATFTYDEDIFKNIGSMGLWVNQGPTIPYYVGNGNTNLTRPSETLFDWRALGVARFVTSFSNRATPPMVDTIYSDVRDIGSHSTYTRHDRWGQPLKIITHNKKDTTTFYRTGFFVDSIRSAIGTIDHFSYDVVAGGRTALVSSVPAGEDSRAFQYDNAGQVSRITTNGTRHQWFYRSGGNPAKIDSVIVDGYRTQYQYDAKGRVVSETDPIAGHVVQAFFDDTTGNLRKRLHPGSRFDSIRYDAYGRDSILAVSAGPKRILTYDLLNRPTRDSVAGAVKATTFAYNKDFLIRVVDPKNQVFKRAVNALGWTRKIYDGGDTTKYVIHEYTLEGQPALFVNRRGQWKEITYWNNDNRHLMTATNTDTNYNTASYAFGYRMSGSVRTGMFVMGSNRYATDSVWLNQYGRLDSAITRIVANRSSGINDNLAQRRYVRRYVWTNDDRLQSLTFETRQAGTGSLIRNFSTRRYWWNSTTRALDSITMDGLAATAKMKRDAEGKDSTVTFVTENLTFGIASTQRHQAWAQSFSVAPVDSVLQRGYGYDSTPGRLKEMNWRIGNNMYLRRFGYAAPGDLSWLKDFVAYDDCATPPTSSVTDVDGWTCSPTSPLNYRTLGLEYDQARNLRKQVDSVGSLVDTAVVAAGNRMTNWGTRSYTFDVDGNMITRSSGGTTTTFSYDGENMMRRSIVGSDTTCYEYNAFNQLVFSGIGCARNTQPGISVRKPKRIYVWDGDHLIAEIDSLASTRFAEYVYRPGIDRPHALLSDSGSTTIVRFYHQDRLGNVIGLTRGTSLAQTLAYEPWGVLVDSTGAMADTSRLRWKGLYWEGGKTKLYYVRNRWYDPEARRFTSEDPIGIDGGLNPYIFAGNDPVNGSDPSGLAPCTEESLAKGFISVYVDTGESGGWWCYDPGAGQPLGGVTVRSDWPSGFSDNFGNPCARGGSCGSGGTGDYNAGVINGLSGGLIGSGDSKTAAYQIGLVLGTIGGLGTGGTEFQLLRALWRTMKFAQGSRVAYATLGRFTVFTWEVAGNKGAGYVRWNKVVNSEGQTIRLYKDVYGQGGDFIRRDPYTIRRP
jgi:RHS repeat-associated protein